jgi:hypothetical protein
MSCTLILRRQEAPSFQPASVIGNGSFVELLVMHAPRAIDRAHSGGISAYIRGPFSFTPGDQTTRFGCMHD